MSSSTTLRPTAREVWLELSFHLVCSKNVDTHRHVVQKVAVAHIHTSQPPTRPKPAVNKTNVIYGTFSNPYVSHLMTQPSAHTSLTHGEKKKKKRQVSRDRKFSVILVPLVLAKQEIDEKHLEARC